MNTKELSIEDFDITFDEEIEETYVVRVEHDLNEFLVNCQTDEDHNRRETAYLTCFNESGGDFYDSGLAEYLVKIGIEEYGDLYRNIASAIAKEAESYLHANDVLRIIQEKENDDTYELEDSLFGAFGPTDVHHYKYTNSADEIIVTSQDNSEPKAENELLAYKKFYSDEDYEKWIELIYENDHYSDCTVSYRAYLDITQDQ